MNELCWSDCSIAVLYRPYHWSYRRASGFAAHASCACKLGNVGLTAWLHQLSHAGHSIDHRLPQAKCDAVTGVTYHNMAAFRQRDGGQDAQVFSNWVVNAMTRKTGTERAELLEHWQEAPKARIAHPREEHLMPLMVAVGAAGDDAGSVAFDGPHMGVRCLSFMFG